MKKTFFTILAIGFLGSLPAQMACKDSVFTVNYDQNMCLFNVWGEWKEDSVLDSDGRVLTMKYTDKVWKFNSALSLSETFTLFGNKETNTARYKFLKGYLQLDDYTFKGSTVLTPISYKVLYLSPTRLVLSETGPGGKLILKKILN